MKPQGIRDIIGPIMVGPSSSHTAGALRIASMARSLLAGEPVHVKFTLYGSFSQTYKGHGTDKALVAGMLGMHTDDTRIATSFSEARSQGLEFEFVCDALTKTDHPNTVDIEAVDATGMRVSVRGVSIGGGAAELRLVDGVAVNITGESTSLIIRQNDEPGVLAHVSGLLAQAGINIGTVSLYRDRRGGIAIVVMEIDGEVPEEVERTIAEFPAILSVRIVPADSSHQRLERKAPVISVEEALDAFAQIDFASAAEMLRYCDENGCTLSRAFMRRDEMLLACNGRSAEGTHVYLEKVLRVMRESVRPQGRPTMGRLIGGESLALDALEARGGGLGLAWGRLCSYATGVLETNASMGRIVAAPTAGSSGVIPAVLLYLQEQFGLDDDALKAGLVNAAAVGQIIARNATVAGAEGGCQAEVGSASAMAASMAVELMGGTPAMCLDAAGIALANMLGLVCDPIGGLVEAPCQKRNASGAANALVSAEMALAGIHSDAPFDEIVDVMAKVGRSLPYELRETALGGMAACPSCKKCRSARASPGRKSDRRPDRWPGQKTGRTSLRLPRRTRRAWQRVRWHSRE